MEKEVYKRLHLKNGWDLPQGEKPPLIGRKQKLVRAYELLIRKSDEEYIQQAEAAKEKRSARRAKNEWTVGGKTVATTEHTISSDAQSTAWEAELRDATDDGWKARKKKRIRMACAIVAAAVVIIGGRLLLGSPILIADISAYENVEITIEGLAEEPFDVTPKELSKMRLASASVDVHEVELGPEDTEELGKAIGPTLETFLKEYGVDLEDVRSMRVYKENEKSVAYAHSIHDGDIILSVANGRKPLGLKEAPLRIVAEGTEPGEWTGWVRRIVFTLK